MSTRRLQIYIPNKLVTSLQIVSCPHWELVLWVLVRKVGEKARISGGKKAQFLASKASQWVKKGICYQA